MPSWSLISLRRIAFGLRSAAKTASRTASCSGVTRPRFLRSGALASQCVAESSSAGLTPGEDAEDMEDDGEGAEETSGCSSPESVGR